MNFEIDVKNIKIASSQEKVSQTIEGLLQLNDKIPAHTDTEVMDTIEKQLDDSKYNNKPSRGEAEGITESQMVDDKRHGDPVEAVQEGQFEKAKRTDGGHRPREFKDNEKIRGHKKENIANIWLDVYEREDDRKKDKMEKKLGK